ncbi:riboflavin kinase/FMN adenylyltransferase [Evansella vedderi]|uniref:FAD synthase n=1 Tax=Evansella vedderi TaxID=38282 RepID=A0ABT9ZNK4_9BACI|nr:FAD synthetase family protein [Evansella vedderi]MDQ0252812.1 riboflavin kinase/FMN adenylyltransferase [Evansella vedderi]
MIIYDAGDLHLPASVLTIGSFDGIHKGHQTLLLKAKERANRLNAPFVVFTFDPPPKVFLTGCKQLMPLDDKLERLKEIGVDYVIIAKFNKAFMQKEVSEFIKEIHDLNPLEIWEGPNFLFGKNREGTIEVLRKHFDVNIVSLLICSQGKMISSSRIRELLKQGEIIEADRLLGDYTFK